MSEKQLTIDEQFGNCPYATVQKLISGKWSILILHELSNGPIRFNELHRQLPKMTHATLITQLKYLEENKLVLRKEDEESPQKVEYSLTEIGLKIIPVFDAFKEWGMEYINYIKEN